MNGYYIFLMFIVSFALAFVTKILLNEKLENMVHTMESLMILLAVILFLCGTNQYYVLFMILFCMYRAFFRVIADCCDIIRENKYK